MSLSLAIWSRAVFGLGAGEPGHQRARHLALVGLSSIEEGRSASGSMPTWPSSVSRRGEALASTSLGLRPARRPVGLERASSLAQRLAARAVGAGQRVDQRSLGELMWLGPRRANSGARMPTGCGENQAGCTRQPVWAIGGRACHFPIAQRV